MSDWKQNLKPIAAKVYGEIAEAHGENRAGIIVEAIELARRRAECQQAEESWHEKHQLTELDSAVFIDVAEKLFQSLCDELGTQRAVHTLGALERESIRRAWGNDMKAWRARVGKTPEQAAIELDLTVEEIQDIEDSKLCAGPEAMRLIRPALKRVRAELGEN